MSKSDLDADLYGDLYGGDEAEYGNDFGESSEAKDTSSKPAASEPTKISKEPPSKPKPASTGTPSATTSIPAYVPPKSTSPPAASAPKPAPIPRLEGTSSIPVFTEESQNNNSIGNRAAPSYSSPAAQSYSQYNQGQNQDRGGYAGGERAVRPSEMRDEGKMFVGGLNWDTTDETLRQYFSQFGRIDACTIMRDAAGRSRGFAFLTFEEPAAVNAVMVREHFLDGKIIDPKRAIPRLEHHRTQKIFVGGLAASVTTESMKQFFGQYGKVVDATVMIDRDSSRSKGFGFVTFEDAPAVEKLVQIQNLELEGKMIEVKLAQPRGAGGLMQGQTSTPNQFQNRNGPAVQPGGGMTNSMQQPSAASGSATPFDPQAMAMLYQRMFQMSGNGAPGAAWGQGVNGMNPMMGMMGSMNPMMGAGMGRGMMGGPGMMGGAGGANGMLNPGMMGATGSPLGAGAMGGMGRGGPGMGMGMGMGGIGMGATPMAGGQMTPGGNAVPMAGGAGGGPGGGIPRGPAAMRGANGMGGPQAQQQAPPPGSVGPTRFGTKGQHSYHPYGR